MKPSGIRRSVLTLFAAAGAAVFGQDTGPVAAARGIYEQTLQKHEQEYQAALQALPARYEKQLEELGVAFQQGGNLEGLLAVNQEKARFRQSRTVPDAPPPNLPADIAKRQADFRAAQTQARQERSRQIVALTQRYLARLDELKRDLTTQGKIDEALSAKAEYDRVERLAVYAQARKDAPPAGAPKPTPPDAPKEPAEKTLPDSLQNGLVLDYSFDKDEGPSVKDLSGKNEPGVLRGARWAGLGTAGGACRFDQAGDTIDCGRNSALQITGNLTYSLWIKTSAAFREGAILLCRRGGDARDAIASDLEIAADGKLYLVVHSGDLRGAPQGTHGNATLSDDRWHHVAGVFVAGRSIAVFVDGRRAGDSKSAHVYRSLNPRSLPVQVGGSGRRWSYQGLIDDVMIYDRALTDGEIRTLYQFQRADGRATAPPAGGE